MNKLLFFVGVALMTICSAARAQEGLTKSDYIPEISLEARGSYYHNLSDGVGRFSGDMLAVSMDGLITPNLSYSLYHRIAAPYYGDITGFDATSWLTLTWEVGDFSFTAGKDALFVGSFEYDAADIDSYFDMNSIFYNMFECWQWGASAAWYPEEGQSLSFQMANSPFVYDGTAFAYALAWRGEWDFYESYWTANLWQLEDKSFYKSINFGNRFYLGDFGMDLDFMTRALDMSDLFKSDMTLAVAPSYQCAEWCRAFVKFGWERCSDAFPWEFEGENIFYGAGVEFFPLKENKDIRIHAAWASNTEYTQSHTIEAGVTWRMHLTQAAKNLFLKLDK